LILGIGTDLASIDRVAGVLEQHGERFIERCFGPGEREKVERAAQGDVRVLAAGYAKRWAAKEACAKALGLGISGDIYLRDIVVGNGADGQPGLTLTGGAKERLTALTPEGMTARVHISLTDEQPMALAFVIIAAEPPEKRNRD
jgi:holo-[acyl-carrier protein] synthase